METKPPVHMLALFWGLLLLQGGSCRLHRLLDQLARARILRQRRQALPTNVSAA